MKLLALLLLSSVAYAADCKVSFTVVARDHLNNVTQGLSTENQKWFEQKVAKKYPGVCYVSPTIKPPLVLYIGADRAVYHGSRTVSTTSTSPVSGRVNDEYGMQVATISGTTETTSTNVVPETVNYSVLTLSVETKDADGKWKVVRNFQGKTLHPTMYGICTRNCHPNHALIEDAVKWLSAGGLTDPLQGHLEPEQR